MNFGFISVAIHATYLSLNLTGEGVVKSTLAFGLKFFIEKEMRYCVMKFQRRFDVENP